jgi:hypothetical protein
MLKLWYSQRNQRFNMAYIGRGTESISNVEVLDNLTFDGSSSYTLQKSSTNFVPSSANNLLISISGVVQQGNFSVSGSTITFDTTVSGSDTCDWILHYGTGLITTVADGAITEAKLGSNAVTTAKINDSAITSAKINNGAITSAKLDSGLALGKIGQVVSTLTNDNLTTNSTSYSSIMSLSITPSSSSSKILIHHTAVSDVVLSNTSNIGNIALFRDSTNITTAGHNSSYHSYTGRSRASGSAIMHLDSPSSTSAISYSVRGKVDNTGLTMNYGTSTQQRCVSLTLMEVLA